MKSTGKSPVSTNKSPMAVYINDVSPGPADCNRLDRSENRGHKLGFSEALAYQKTPSLLYLKGRLLIAASMQPARMEELETCFGDDNRFIAKHENQIKGCLLSHLFTHSTSISSQL
ncbi:BnaA05g19370D [Brassica napus]|uniref:BnaA05g19370D protein n=1 Tax=Brassica napus TaxID=3708 RepID=A0A078GJI4_BRANA|nr:BnaA05g19370D [Brassica napus]